MGFERRRYDRLLLAIAVFLVAFRPKFEKVLSIELGGQCWAYSEP